MKTSTQNEIEAVEEAATSSRLTKKARLKTSSVAPKFKRTSTGSSEMKNTSGPDEEQSDMKLFRKGVNLRIEKAN